FEHLLPGREPAWRAACGFVQVKALGNESGSPSSDRRARVRAGSASASAGRRVLRRAGTGGETRCPLRRLRGGDLPTPRWAAACARARGLAGEDSRPAALARTARATSPAAHRRRARCARASTDAACDDRVELRPARPSPPARLLVPGRLPRNLLVGRRRA